MSPNVAERPFLTRRELAELLRVSTRTVDRLARRGALRPVRPTPGRTLFAAAEVEWLLAGEPRDA